MQIQEDQNTERTMHSNTGKQNYSQGLKQRNNNDWSGADLYPTMFDPEINIHFQ